MCNAVITLLIISKTAKTSRILMKLSELSELSDGCCLKPDQLIPNHSCLGTKNLDKFLMRHNLQRLFSEILASEEKSHF